MDLATVHPVVWTAFVEALNAEKGVERALGRKDWLAFRLMYPVKGPKLHVKEMTAVLKVTEKALRQACARALSKLQRKRAVLSDAIGPDDMPRLFELAGKGKGYLLLAYTLICESRLTAAVAAREAESRLAKARPGECDWILGVRLIALDEGALNKAAPALIKTLEAATSYAIPDELCPILKDADVPPEDLAVGAEKGVSLGSIEAIDLVGRIGIASDGVLVEILKYLESGEAWTRLAAASTLLRLERNLSEAKEALIALLDAADPRVRKGAAFVFFRWPGEPEPVVRYLLNRLSSEQDGGARLELADTSVYLSSKDEGLSHDIVARLVEESEGAPELARSMALRAESLPPPILEKALPVLARWIGRFAAA